jgi:hypothetical protein
MADEAVRAEIVLAQGALARALDRLGEREGAVAEANFRTQAVQTVLAAVLTSVTWRGLDRRQFRKLIHDASRRVPATGPASVQHEVLLNEARRVLELEP